MENDFRTVADKKKLNLFFRNLYKIKSLSLIRVKEILKYRKKTTNFKVFCFSMDFKKLKPNSSYESHETKLVHER